MPELKPRTATAVLNKEGFPIWISIEYATALIACGNADEYATTLLSCKDADLVPCLILPAPRPIAECPEEWKDGRTVWLYASGSNRWLSAYYDIPGEYWESDDGGLDDREVTHIMLPPPSPKEANRA